MTKKLLTRWRVSRTCWRWKTWVCDQFRDNDQGVCLECGHYEECHERP